VVGAQLVTVPNIPLSTAEYAVAMGTSTCTGKARWAACTHMGSMISVTSCRLDADGVSVVVTAAVSAEAVTSALLSRAIGGAMMYSGWIVTSGCPLSPYRVMGRVASIAPLIACERCARGSGVRANTIDPASAAVCNTIRTSRPDSVERREMSLGDEATGAEYGDAMSLVAPLFLSFSPCFGQTGVPRCPPGSNAGRRPACPSVCRRRAWL